MSRKSIRRFAKKAWSEVRKIVGSDLKQPPIFITGMKEITEEVSRRLGEKPEEQEIFCGSDMLEYRVDVPGNHAQIELFDDNSIEILYGGIVIPPEFADKGDLTKAIIVHEMLHNLLGSSSMMYGLYGMFQQMPEVQRMYGEFEEVMVHAHTIGLLDRMNLPRDQYHAAASYVHNLLRGEPDKQIDKEELRNIIEGLEEFYRKVKDINPVDDSLRCMGIFADTTAEMDDDLNMLCIISYDALKKMDLTAKRRDKSGKWEKVDKKF